MAGDFTIQIYTNPVRGNMLLASHWGAFAEGLTFSSNAFGGYAACEFALRFDYPQLLGYINGYAGQPSYVTNRIRITDPFGAVCYEGMLYALQLRAGSEELGVSADNLFNCVAVSYDVPYKTRTDTKFSYYDDAASRTTFAKKTARLNLPGAYPAATTTPASTARRFIKQHRKPGKPNSKKKGGDSADMAMQVSCVGLATPALEWRYAFSNLAAQVDTSQIVKDMLGANPIAEGVTGAGRGPTNSGWVEILNAANTLGYGQPFLHSSNFGNLASSGTLVERNCGSGKTRIEIVQQAAQYGSVNDRRMLFQVWDDGAANAGKGLAYFTEMSETRPLTTGYNGYYDHAHLPIVRDAGLTRIPLWRVRAGKWLTTLGIVPDTSYGSVYDDPRCFWIEETTYDVDNATLTLSSSSEFNLEQYVGRLIGGKRIIKDAG